MRSDLLQSHGSRIDDLTVISCKRRITSESLTLWELRYTHDCCHSNPYANCFGPVTIGHLSKADQEQSLADMMVDDNDCTDGTDRHASVSSSAASGDALQQTANQQKVLNTIRQHIGKFRGDENRQAGYVVLLSESIQACMMVNLEKNSSPLAQLDNYEGLVFWTAVLCTPVGSLDMDSLGMKYFSAGIWLLTALLLFFAAW